MFQVGLKILFVGDAQSVAHIDELLCATDIGQFELECIFTHLATVNSFGRNYHDVCLIDSAHEGINLLMESRRVGFTAPIIMLTANSATEVLIAFRKGVSDCLLREDLTAAALEQSICAAVERARAVECQAHRERCYLGLLENASEVIFTHDLEGRYTSINKAGELLTGYKREELLAMNFSQLIAPEHIDLVWRMITRLLTVHSPVRYTTVAVAKDCRRIPLEVATHLIYREGIPVEVQGVARRVDKQISTSLMNEDEWSCANALNN